MLLVLCSPLPPYPLNFLNFTQIHVYPRLKGTVGKKEIPEKLWENSGVIHYTLYLLKKYTIAKIDEKFRGGLPFKKEHAPVLLYWSLVG